MLMKIIFVVGMGIKFLAIQKQKWGNLSKIKVSHTFNHCGRWDLNPHERNAHKILSLARLPVPTLPLDLRHNWYNTTKELISQYIFSNFYILFLYFKFKNASLSLRSIYPYSALLPTTTWANCSYFSITWTHFFSEDRDTCRSLPSIRFHRT